MHALRMVAAGSFAKQLWQITIDDYNRLLVLDENNANAYQQRGRAYAFLRNWELAFEVIL